MLKLCVLSLLALSWGTLTWSDWDGLQTCHPIDYVLPTTEEEIVSLVVNARKAGTKIKVVGAGHSFSAIPLTDGHMLSLDNYSAILAVNPQPDGSTTVRIQAGIRLYVLNAQLEALGLSIENLGATAAQSLAGVTATGTHGTGTALGSMSTQIVGFRIIDGQGNVLECNKTYNADIFAAGRVGLGALGIITEISLRTVPLFRLRLTLTTIDLDDLISQLPALMAKYERLQWYWFPYNEAATLVTREVTTDPIDPPGLGCWGGVNESETGSSVCVDVSYKALTDSRTRYAQRTLYTEMEMFVPQDQAINAINDFRAYQEQVKPRHNASQALFTGMRYVAADDIPLSPLNGRAGAVISFIVEGTTTQTGSPEEFAMYGQYLEQMCTDKYAGRPHWGKQNWATNATLVTQYPAASWDAFLKLRARMDPDGIFLNPYLQQRLGI